MKYIKLFESFKDIENLLTKYIWNSSFDCSANVLIIFLNCPEEVGKDFICHNF